MVLVVEGAVVGHNALLRVHTQILYTTTSTQRHIKTARSLYSTAFITLWSLLHHCPLDLEIVDLLSVRTYVSGIIHQDYTTL